MRRECHRLLIRRVVGRGRRSRTSRRPCGVRFQVAEATNLPFADDEFDLVYTNKTTHHIPDWPQALAEIARVLKPGGRLLYSDFVAPAGRRLPTRRGIDAAAEASGLKRRVPPRRSLPLHSSLSIDRAQRRKLNRQNGQQIMERGIVKFCGSPVRA
jgi:ubiquinone/menaquinone biosynthesis C-methylase UbiE